MQTGRDSVWCTPITLHPAGGATDISSLPTIAQLNTEIESVTTDNRSWTAGRLSNATVTIGGWIQSTSNAAIFGTAILDSSGFDLTGISGVQRNDGGVRINVEGISASSSKPKCSILMTQFNGSSDVIFGAYNDKSWSQADTFTYTSYGFSNINGATQFKHIFSQTLSANSATGEYHIQVVVGDGTFTKAYERILNLNSWDVDTSGLLTSSAFSTALSPLVAGNYVRQATLYYCNVTIERATAALYNSIHARYIPAGMLFGQTSQDQDGVFKHVVFDYDEQNGRIRRGYDLSQWSLPAAQQTVLGYASAKIGLGSMTLASRQ